jgi:hypothetical protein
MNMFTCYALSISYDDDHLYNGELLLLPMHRVPSDLFLLNKEAAPR